LDSKPSNIEPDRWYDLKLTVSGKNVKCWLDGELIHDLDFENHGKIDSLYATSATDAQVGEVIVKVVNASAASLETELTLNGTDKLPGTGTATVLTSEEPSDENSLADPLKVSPKTEPVSFSGTS